MLYNQWAKMLDFPVKYGEKAVADASLEIWDNPSPERDYEVQISFPEFTCLCPRSGYPDFGVMHVRYMPAKKIVELKSLKLYLNAFRSRHASHEAVTNLIYSELYSKLRPKYLEVTGDFNPRGNVKTLVRVSSDFMKKRSGNAQKKAPAARTRK